MRTRIKFCGMTRIEDVLEAADLGADAVGLVFAPRSPRRLELGRARELARAMPPFLTKVALFADQDAAEVEAVLSAVQPDVLQFHGQEDAAYCARFDRPYLKAVPMGDVAVEPDAYFGRFPDAAAFVLDAHAMGGSGGSGRRFDWSRIPARRERRVVLAGGLMPGNVYEAVRTVQPYGVDVASGIESAPGLKDYAKMRAFIAEVARADNL